MDTKKVISAFDVFLDNANKAGDIYSKVTLAKQGIVTPAPPIAYQTTGANDPAVIVGQPANVKASDRFAEVADNFINKSAAVAGANEFRKSLPYLVGFTALGITIYLLTKK